MITALSDAEFMRLALASGLAATEDQARDLLRAHGYLERMAERVRQAAERDPQALLAVAKLAASDNG